jgi:biopolymer transport protein ExbD
MAMNVGNRDGGTIASINVTPMADVMIVLLIIFMVTVPLISQGKVHLPPAAHAKEGDKKDSAFVLEIDARGQLSIEGTVVGDVTAALREVAERVGADPVRPVQIKADRDVSYRTVATVLDACRGAGAEVLSLATERPGVR